MLNFNAIISVHLTTERVNEPHDKFFKVVFGQVKNARSFIKSRLKGYYSDLLYQVQLNNGQQTYVYLLLEHTKSPGADDTFPAAALYGAYMEK